MINGDIFQGFIYDCEIKKAIQGRNEERLEGIEYCDGWRDFENMGITVVGVYDYVEDRYRVFTKDNLPEFQGLINNRQFAVSFNGINFDNPLLKANGISIPDVINYDILRKVWESAGNDPDIFDKNTHTGFGLDQCCEANFETRKTGNGALAPVLWQKGQYGQVIDYCLNDIKLTKQLLDRILETGFLINPRDKEQALHIKLPISPF